MENPAAQTGRNKPANRATTRPASQTAKGDVRQIEQLSGALASVGPAPMSGTPVAAGNRSIVRAGKGKELGTFKPVQADLMPLGGTLGYKAETFELTPFSFVIYEDTTEGEHIEFRSGSTLVDGRFFLRDEHDNPCIVPFIGKVTEEVEIQSESKGSCLGYLVRIAQISIDDQYALTQSLKAMETI
jgi:hypothetical protein